MKSWIINISYFLFPFPLNSIQSASFNSSSSQKFHISPFEYLRTCPFYAHPNTIAAKKLWILFSVLAPPSCYHNAQISETKSQMKEQQKHPPASVDVFKKINNFSLFIVRAVQDVFLTLSYRIVCDQFDTSVGLLSPLFFAVDDVWNNSSQNYCIKLCYIVVGSFSW